MSSEGAASGEGQKVFSGVRYFLNDDLKVEDREELAKSLEANGATPSDSPAPNALEGPSSSHAKDSPRFDPATTTHVITAGINFKEYDLCDDPQADGVEGGHEKGRPIVVTPSWVRRSVQLKQMQAERFFSADPANIFSGIVVCCSKLSKMDTELICAGVASLGGGWKQKLTKEVTHLVCLERSGAKFEKVAAHPESGIRAVLPHWVDDSFKLLHLLDDDAYAFPLDRKGALPPLLAGRSLSAPFGVTNVRKNTDNFDVTSRGRAPFDEVVRGLKEGDRLFVPPPAPADEGESPQKQVGEPVRFPAVLYGKAVLLSSEWSEATPMRTEPLAHRVRMAGGSWIPPPTSKEGIAQAVRNADVVICKYRDSLEYKESIRQRKTVATIIWLFHIVSTGRVSSPSDNLLHYPVPKESVDGFENMIITITNYTGDARLYLKDLINKMGGHFTPEMTTANTHCIAASRKGEKVRRAQEWEIPVLNHMWLEACFVRWQSLNPAQNRFIEFPPGVDLQSTVGKVSLSEQDLLPWTSRALERTEDAGIPQAMLEEQDAAMADVTMDADLVSPHKRSALTHRRSLRDDDAASAVGTPTPAGRRNGAGGRALAGAEAPDSTAISRIGSLATFDADQSDSPSDRQKKRPASVSGTSPTKKASGKGRAFEELRPGGVEAEIERQGQARGDSSANKKRKVSGNGTTSTEDRPPAPSYSATAADEEEVEVDQRVGSPAMSKSKNDKAVPSASSSKAKAKPARSSNEPASTSGGTSSKNGGSSSGSSLKLKFATTGVDTSDAELKTLTKLGVIKTEDMTECMVLVAKGFSRTEKFLCAIAKGTVDIVGANWIKDTVKVKEVHDPKEYALSDPANEKKYGARLTESLQRSRSGPLLSGHTFYVTRSVQPDVDTLRRIVESAGGVVPRRDANSELLLGNPGEYHLISCEKDRKLWQALVQKERTSEGEKLAVYSSELLIASVLRQKMEWDQHRLS